MIMRSICVLQLVLMFVVLGRFQSQNAFAATSSHVNTEVPSGVKAQIGRELPDWRIMELSDLSPDDQRIWTTAHSNEPPGIAVGYFENAHQLGYALNLVREENGHLYQMLVVVAKGRKGTYETHKLQEPMPAIPCGTILRWPPGVYSGLPEYKVRTRLDSILYEQLEVNAILYYWKRGRYHQLAIKD